MDQSRRLEGQAADFMEQAHKAVLLEEKEKRAYDQRRVEEQSIGLIVDLVRGLMGMKLEKYSPLKDPPFGTVLVAIGNRGVPHDVIVINVSALARKEGLRKSIVKEALVATGCSLFTPRDFRVLAAWLRTEILEGRAQLPYRSVAMASGQ